MKFYARQAGVKLRMYVCTVGFLSITMNLAEYFFISDEKQFRK